MHAWTPILPLFIFVHTGHFLFVFIVSRQENLHSIRLAGAPLHRADLSLMSTIRKPLHIFCLKCLLQNHLFHLELLYRSLSMPCVVRAQVLRKQTAQCARLRSLVMSSLGDHPTTVFLCLKPTIPGWSTAELVRTVKINSKHLTIDPVTGYRTVHRIVRKNPLPTEPLQQLFLHGSWALQW